MSWRSLLAIITAAGAFAWLGFKVLQDPDASDSIVWALKSWIHPPDEDAGWQQGPG